MSICQEIQNTIDKRDPPFIIKRSNEILVSIIVVNRNGVNHLKTLIPALIANTCDIQYELILVDNASSDDSVMYTESTLKKDNPEIPFKVIQNKVNESFSVANNSAAEIAKGKYLVLLNNDIEPLSGWLNYLLDSAESIESVGSIGARLVYPYRKKPSFFSKLLNNPKDNSCLIQHAGIAFNDEGMQFRPYNLAKGKPINDPAVLKSGSKSALTAACLLVPKDKYLQVGGLDEAYNYGGEDVDLGLKLLKAGYINYYCADSILFHHEFGTQNKEKQDKGATRRQKNLQVFQKKWFLHVKKKYWAEKIFSESNLYAERPLTIAVLDNELQISKDNKAAIEKFGWNVLSVSQKQLKQKNISTDFDFVLTHNNPDDLTLYNQQLSISTTKKNGMEFFRNALIQRFLKPSIAIKIPAKTWKGTYSWGDYHMAVLLKQQLENLGHYVLLQIFPEWDNDEGLECDVAIVLRGVSSYKVKPQQVNIMWNISHPDDVSFDEYEEYDMVFIASELWANEISKQVSVPVYTMLQCSDVERFREPNKKEKEENHQQLLFVGNSRGVFRKILKDLLPTDYSLAVYGRRWNKILPRNIVKGEHIPNEELYLHYGSADILLNDHWEDMREKGFVSNRIFDGLACGAFIITDSVSDMGVINEYVQVYETPKELKEHVEFYLNNPEVGYKKAQKGMEFVSQKHTFKERAEQFSESIHSLLNNRCGSESCGKY